MTNKADASVSAEIRSAVLTKDEAHALTSQIKANVQELSILIKKAHDGRVWEPLGYGSFTEWIRGEFGWSHTRGFQILNIAEVADALNEAVSLPDGFQITDNQARQIVSLGRSGYIEEFAKLAGDDPQANLRALLDDLREKANKGAPAPPKPVPHAVPKLGPLSPADFRVSGGVRNSQTGLVLSRSVGRQAGDFPNPKLLRQENVEGGIALLLRAKRDIQAKYDAILELALARTKTISEEMKETARAGQEREDAIKDILTALGQELQDSDLTVQEKLVKFQEKLESEGAVDVLYRAQ